MILADVAHEMRKSIWLPKAEIALASWAHASGMTGSRAQIDRTIGVVDGVTATPVETE